MKFREITKLEWYSERKTQTDQSQTPLSAFVYSVADGRIFGFVLDRTSGFVHDRISVSFSIGLSVSFGNALPVSFTIGFRFRLRSDFGFVHDWTSGFVQDPWMRMREWRMYSFRGTCARHWVVCKMLNLLKNWPLNLTLYWRMERCTEWWRLIPMSDQIFEWNWVRISVEQKF